MKQIAKSKRRGWVAIMTRLPDELHAELKREASQSKPKKSLNYLIVETLYNRPPPPRPRKDGL